MEEVGHERYRAEQIMRWIYHQKITNFEQMVNIPKVMRKQLSRQLVFTEPEIQSEHISRCGTIKWLIGCDKKNAVETVYIPEAKRATLCISSQVGWHANSAQQAWLAFFEIYQQLKSLAKYSMQQDVFKPSLT